MSSILPSFPHPLFPEEQYRYNECQCHPLKKLHLQYLEIKIVALKSFKFSQ